MKKILEFLSTDLEVAPKSYGMFHFICIFLVIISIIILNKKKNKTLKNLKKVLLIYGYIALILEIIKQIIWSYDISTNTWSYTWYAAPYQLCTTSIFASLIAAYTKHKSVRNSMLAYLGFFTILGSISTMIYPETCFCRTIEVNIHTMFLHGGSLVVSVYALMNYIEFNFKSFNKGFISFLCFELIALVLNIVIYNSGILHGSTFNMFYISPYFISPLPVFSYLQTNLSYLLYLLSYNLVILFGGFIIYIIFKKIKKKA